MERLIRLREVQARTGLAKTTIYQRVRMGAFPAPVSLEGRLTAWVESEIQGWIDSRIADRTQSARDSSQIVLVHSKNEDSRDYPPVL
jgi:prophage regulatory protein